MNGAGGRGGGGGGGVGGGGGEWRFTLFILLKGGLKEDFKN